MNRNFILLPLLLLCVPAHGMLTAFRGTVGSCFVPPVVRVLAAVRALAAKARMSACDAEVFIRQGKTDVVQELLAAHAIKATGRDCDGDTLLHTAAYENHACLVRPLIKAGIKVDAKNRNGETPLVMTFYNGKKEAAYALIKAGANYKYALANITGIPGVTIDAIIKFCQICKAAE